MKQLILTAHGPLTSAIDLVDAPLPSPGPGEVRIRVERAPILPMDRLIVAGHYPLRPDRPFVPGAEGVGCIDAVGDGVEPELEGRRALLPIRAGSWRQALCCPASDIHVLCDGAEPDRAACWRVNGASAAVLLGHVPAGSWVISAPGTGGVGLHAAWLARESGVRLLAVVRSPERCSVALRWGAAAVLVDGPDLHRQVRDVVDGPVVSALDGVGGEVTERLGRCLAPGGVVHHYGAMSRRGPHLGVADVIFRQVSLRGFWLYRWTQTHGRTAEQAVLNTVAAAAPPSEIASVVPLTDWRHAMGQVQDGVTGRILLDPSA